MNWLCKMEEVIAHMSNGLAIVDEEDLNIVQIDDPKEIASGRFWLVGKLLTNKQYCFKALRGTLKRLWKLREEVTIFQWPDSDRILFSFGSNADRGRVLGGSPWTFDNALVLLTAFDGVSDPVQVPLDRQAFWVRVRGVKPEYITLNLAERIGRQLGIYYPIGGGFSEDGSGRFLRIRVGLKVSQPLQRWVKISVGTSLVPEKFQLEYEHLPYLCFFCGRLDHVNSGCSLHKDGVIVEERFGRWRTTAKDVFYIDPECSLKGERFGLFPKLKVWSMKVQDDDFVDRVRSRTSFEEENGMEMAGMEVEGQGVEMSGEPPSKRRRQLSENLLSILPRKDEQSNSRDMIEIDMPDVTESNLRDSQAGFSSAKFIGFESKTENLGGIQVSLKGASTRGKEKIGYVELGSVVSKPNMIVNGDKTQTKVSMEGIFVPEPEVTKDKAISSLSPKPKTRTLTQKSVRSGGGKGKEVEIHVVGKQEVRRGQSEEQTAGNDGRTLEKKRRGKKAVVAQGTTATGADNDHKVKCGKGNKGGRGRGFVVGHGRVYTRRSVSHFVSGVSMSADVNSTVMGSGNRAHHEQ